MKRKPSKKYIQYLEDGIRSGTACHHELQDYLDAKNWVYMMRIEDDESCTVTYKHKTYTLPHWKEALWKMAREVIEYETK